MSWVVYPGDSKPFRGSRSGCFTTGSYHCVRLILDKPNYQMDSCRSHLTSTACLKSPTGLPTAQCNMPYSCRRLEATYCPVIPERARRLLRATARITNNVSCRLCCHYSRTSKWLNQLIASLSMHGISLPGLRDCTRELFDDRYTSRTFDYGMARACEYFIPSQASKKQMGYP